MPARGAGIACMSEAGRRAGKAQTGQAVYLGVVIPTMNAARHMRRPTGHL